MAPLLSLHLSSPCPPGASSAVSHTAAYTAHVRTTQRLTKLLLLLYQISNATTHTSTYCEYDRRDFFVSVVCSLLFVSPLVIGFFRRLSMTLLLIMQVLQLAPLARHNICPLCPAAVVVVRLRICQSMARYYRTIFLPIFLLYRLVPRV